MPATRLRKLKITRVDTVTRGANQHARILIHKSADSPCPGCQQVDKALSNVKPAPGKKCPVCGHVVPSPTSKGAPMPESTDLAALGEAIKKAVTEATAPLQAQIETLTAERDAAVAKAAEKADPDEINKAELPEPVRKRLEQAEADAAAATERVAKLEDAADTARWQGVAKGLDLVAVAKSTDGDGVAELAALLKTIAKGAGTETVDRLVELLTTAHTRLNESALFAEAGKVGAPASDAEGQLEKLAKGYIEKDATLTMAQALTKAAEAHPDLAVKMQEEILSNA